MAALLLAAVGSTPKSKSIQPSRCGSQQLRVTDVKAREGLKPAILAFYLNLPWIRLTFEIALAPFHMA